MKERICRVILDLFHNSKPLNCVLSEPEITTFLWDASNREAILLELYTHGLAPYVAKWRFPDKQQRSFSFNASNIVIESHYTDRIVHDTARFSSSPPTPPAPFGNMGVNGAHLYNVLGLLLSEIPHGAITFGSYAGRLISTRYRGYTIEDTLNAAFPHLNITLTSARIGFKSDSGCPAQLAWKPTSYSAVALAQPNPSPSPPLVYFAPPESMSASLLPPGMQLCQVLLSLLGNFDRDEITHFISWPQEHMDFLAKPENREQILRFLHDSNGYKSYFIQLTFGPASSLMGISTGWQFAASLIAPNSSPLIDRKLLSAPECSLASFKFSLAGITSVAALNVYRYMCMALEALPEGKFVFSSQVSRGVVAAFFTQIEQALRTRCPNKTISLSPERSEGPLGDSRLILAQLDWNSPAGIEGAAAAYPVMPGTALPVSSTLSMHTSNERLQLLEARCREAEAGLREANEALRELGGKHSYSEQRLLWQNGELKIATMAKNEAEAAAAAARQVTARAEAAAAAARQAKEEV